MDKLIEQAIKNCKINKYEKYFEQVCKEYKRLLDAENQQLNLQSVSGSLPTSEELQEIVVKIAYSQQGEEQADDCYAKMGMLHEFISKYVNGNDR